MSEKCYEDKDVDLLLIGEGEKKHYVLIKDFNTFLYHHTLNHGRKHFCCYCLPAFRTAETFKCHIKDCFKINGKQTIMMPKKDEYIKFKNFERKIKSPLMIYPDFESILVPEDNGKQNPEESYTNKYKKHVACSYGYKLVCVDDKFSKPFKSYLAEDAVYNFIPSMTKESKYCTDVMKKYFNKELVITKTDNEDFENSAKCWVCDNAYVDGDVKVRDHYHITGKYSCSPHSDCNINVKLKHNIPVIFDNLKNYDPHLIMQELGKFNLKINIIPNGLEKYMSFSNNNKLSFIDSFQFLSSSLDSLAKNSAKDDSKYLSQEFDNNVLDLVNQKVFYPYEYMTDFEKFKKQLPSKEKFYSSLTGQKISDKEYEHDLKVWKKFEMKMMKDYHDLYLRCDVLLSADVFKIFRKNSFKNFECTNFKLGCNA